MVALKTGPMFLFDVAISVKKRAKTFGGYGQECLLEATRPGVGCKLGLHARWLNGALRPWYPRLLDGVLFPHADPLAALQILLLLRRTALAVRALFAAFVPDLYWQFRRPTYKLAVISSRIAMKQTPKQWDDFLVQQRY
jgi:hypothetical protein